MEIGKLGVLIGLGASLVALGAYVSALGGSKRALNLARGAYGVAVLAVLFCFGHLMQLMVTHQFRYEYVYAYSSADLRAPFIYAATWAGQEGSFLLWAVCTALVGMIVAWRAGKWEARIMPVYLTSMVALFGVLAALSPFIGLAVGNGSGQYPPEMPWPPANGMGLNPALQNFWMAVHPPVIFFGFAALMVPFSYAIAALLWREYDAWASRALPYVLLASLTLGMGLFMGGYWAYETQGWHGFWAWDPVENASLFPWLGALALMHGLIVQRHRDTMKRTNLLLAVIPWLLFLYGAYLTRSGILSSFSVHAFGSLDNDALLLIKGMTALHGLAGIALLALRWRSITGKPITENPLSRDIAMVVAVVLMVVAAAIYTLGTSWPLIRHARVEPLFYNKVSIALAVPALIIMGIVPFMAWDNTNRERFMARLVAPWFGAIGCGYLVLMYTRAQLADGFVPDTPNLVVVIIGTLGAFAVIANSLPIARLLRANPLTVGGWLAHIGVGLLCAGTVMTNVYEKTFQSTMVEGGPPLVTPYGYALEFAGWTHDAKSKAADQASSQAEADRLRAQITDVDWWQSSHAVKVRVLPIKSNGGAGIDSDPHAQVDVDRAHSFVVEAPVFHNRNLMLREGASESSTMRWPYIHMGWMRDLYILVAADPKLYRATATLAPGQTSAIAYEGDEPTGYTVKFNRLITGSHASQTGTVMRADMELRAPDGRKAAIQPGLLMSSEGGVQPLTVQIPQLNGAAFLDTQLDAATKTVTVYFELPEAPARWVAPISVTNKPMISLVWLGVIMLGIGTAIAMIRRALEARSGAVMVVREDR